MSLFYNIYTKGIPLRTLNLWSFSFQNVFRKSESLLISSSELISSWKNPRVTSLDLLEVHFFIQTANGIDYHTKYHYVLQVEQQFKRLVVLLASPRLICEKCCCKRSVIALLDISIDYTIYMVGDKNLVLTLRVT